MGLAVDRLFQTIHRARCPGMRAELSCPKAFWRPSGLGEASPTGPSAWLADHVYSRPATTHALGSGGVEWPPRSSDTAITADTRLSARRTCTTQSRFAGDYSCIPRDLCAGRLCHVEVIACMASSWPGFLFSLRFALFCFPTRPGFVCALQQRQPGYGSRSRLRI